MKKSQHRHVARRRLRKLHQAMIDERNRWVQSQLIIATYKLVSDRIKHGTLRPVKTPWGGYLEKVPTSP